VPRYDPHDLGAQVYKAIAGRSVNTEPHTATDAVAWFMRQAGGNISAAARLAGVPRESMRDWAKGISKPKAARGEALAKSAQLSERRARLGPRKEARLRAAGDSPVIDIQVTGSYNYDDAPENRAPIVISEYMDTDAGDQLVDAYLAGAGPGELRELFADLIVDAPFYAETMGLPPADTNGWWISNVQM
jgi:hypothetical protein